MAGMPGFEPGNGGIKIRCLTTWLHPITRGFLKAFARQGKAGKDAGMTTQNCAPSRPLHSGRLGGGAGNRRSNLPRSERIQLDRWRMRPVGLEKGRKLR